MSKIVLLLVQIVAMLLWHDFIGFPQTGLHEDALFVFFVLQASDMMFGRFFDS